MMTVLDFQKSLTSPEEMHEAVRALGIVPLFKCGIEGFSIEEMTDPKYWMSEEYDFGPWDWKVDAVAQGDLAYGKFLSGPKTAFATWELYSELMNYRRSLDKYQPVGLQQQVLDIVTRLGSAESADFRKELGIKKAQVDSITARLMLDTRIVICSIHRVYRGADLTYTGWQKASYCLPEAYLKPEKDIPSDQQKNGSPASPFWAKFIEEDEYSEKQNSPEESYKLLFEHIHSTVPGAGGKQIARILG